MITVDEDLLAEAFVINMDLDGLSMDPDKTTEIIMDSSKAVAESIDEVTQSMVKGVTEADSAFAKGMIDGYKKIATVTVTDSTAPETKPDVSAVTGILNAQIDAVRTEAESKARPGITTGIHAQVQAATARLSAASSVEEAYAVIDSLGLDEEKAAMLKATVKEVPAEESSDTPSETPAENNSEAAPEASGTNATNAETAPPAEPAPEPSAEPAAPGVDVTDTIAAIEAMEPAMVDAAVELAVAQATGAI